jgi:hypothetical protein
VSASPTQPRPLDAIKAAVLAGEDITPAEEHQLSHQNDAFNAKVTALEADHDERLALQGHLPPARFERVAEGRYRLAAPEAGCTFDLDRLRRDGGALVGELVVRCTLPGALTFDGILSAGDVNLSSVRARVERAKYLNGRARVEDLDFTGLLEELAQRVIAAEREGAPLRLLRDLPRPSPDAALVVDGLPLLAQHPEILFGDGGAAKSYLALYIAGRLDQAGKRVALYDWELSGEDHRDRLERIFGAVMPGVRYSRCSAPLIYEADRIRRDVQQERLDYLIFDSIVFACHDQPEAAATAAAYFQAVRSLGVGSLHLAHTTKAEGGDQKPFGSAFWANGARATWYLKRSDEGDGEDLATIAAFNRKSNLGARRPPIGWTIDFRADRAIFTRTDPAATPDLARGMTLRQRMTQLLKGGAMAPDDLARELEAKAETINRTARRYRDQFTVLPGGNLGLLERCS